MLIALFSVRYDSDKGIGKQYSQYIQTARTSENNINFISKNYYAIRINRESIELSYIEDLKPKSEIKFYESWIQRLSAPHVKKTSSGVL